jgi:hypothetical protein
MEFINELFQSCYCESWKGMVTIEALKVNASNKPNSSIGKTFVKVIVV